mgnify:CR=1 FL=1
MYKPQNPFKKWEAIQENEKIRFYLCAHINRQVHATTTVMKANEKPIYYAKRKLFDEYPMLLEYLGEPFLYSVESIQQWLQNILHISSTFKAQGTLYLSQICTNYILYTLKP